MPRQKQSNPKPLKLQREEIKQLIKDGSSSQPQKPDAAESLEVPAKKKHHHHKHHHSKKKKPKYKSAMKVKIADKVRNKRLAKALREKQTGKKKKKKKEMEMDDLSVVSNNNNNPNKIVISNIHLNSEVSNLIDTLSPDLQNLTKDKYDLIKERSSRLQQKKDKEKEDSPVKKTPEKITRRTVSEPIDKQASPAKRTLNLQPEWKEGKDIRQTHVEVKDSVLKDKQVDMIKTFAPEVMMRASAPEVMMKKSAPEIEPRNLYLNLWQRNLHLKVTKKYTPEVVTQKHEVMTKKHTLEVMTKKHTPEVVTKKPAPEVDEDNVSKQQQALEALLQITGVELNTMTKHQVSTSQTLPINTVASQPPVVTPATAIRTSSAPGNNIVKITETETGVVKYQLRNESLEEQGLTLVYTAQTTGPVDADLLHSAYKPRKPGRPANEIDSREGRGKKPGRHVCQFCGRRCTKPSVLKKHIRSHTGERPYPCVPCGFWFKTKSNLYKHCKSHAHAIKAGLTPNLEDMGKVYFDDDNDSEETESEDEGQVFMPGMTPTSPGLVGHSLPINSLGGGDSNIPLTDASMINAAQVGESGDSESSKVKIERSELRQRLERRISLNALNEGAMKEIQQQPQQYQQHPKFVVGNIPHADQQQQRPSINTTTVKEEASASPVVQASFALPSEITKSTEDMVMPASAPGTSDILKSILPAEVAGFRIDMETKRAVPVLSNQVATTHSGQITATSTTPIPTPLPQNPPGTPGQLVIPVTGFNIVKSSRGQYHVQIPVQGVIEESINGKDGSQHIDAVQNLGSADMMAVSKPVSKESVQERIQQLITQNEAIVDKATLDSVKPRRTGLYRRDSTSTPPRLETADIPSGESRPASTGRDMPTLVKEGAAPAQLPGPVIALEPQQKVEPQKNTDNEIKNTQTLPVTVSQPPMEGNLLERVLKAPRTSQMPDLAPITCFPVTGFPGPTSSTDKLPHAVTSSELALRVANNPALSHPAGQYRRSESKSSSSNTIKNLLQDRQYRLASMNQPLQTVPSPRPPSREDNEAAQYTHHMLQLQAALQGKLPMSLASNAIQMPLPGATVYVPGGPPGGIYPPQPYRGYPTAEDVQALANAESRMLNRRRKYKSESDASMVSPPRRRGRKPKREMPELALIHDSNSDIPEEKPSGIMSPLGSPHVQLTSQGILPFAVSGVQLHQHQQQQHQHQQHLHQQQHQHQQQHHQHYQQQHQQQQQHQHQQHQHQQHQHQHHQQQHQHQQQHLQHHMPIGLLQTVPRPVAASELKPVSEVSVIQHTSVTPVHSKPDMTPIRNDVHRHQRQTPVLPWQPGLATHLGHPVLPGPLSLQQYSPLPPPVSPALSKSTSPMNAINASSVASPRLTSPAPVTTPQTPKETATSSSDGIPTAMQILAAVANQNSKLRALLHYQHKITVPSTTSGPVLSTGSGMMLPESRPTNSQHVPPGNLSIPSVHVRRPSLSDNSAAFAGMSLSQPTHHLNSPLPRSPQQKRMLNSGLLKTVDEIPKSEGNSENQDGATPKRPKLELPVTSSFQPAKRPLKRPGSLGGKMARGHLTLDIPSPLTANSPQTSEYKPLLKIDPKSLLTPEALSIASSVMKLASPIKPNTPSTPVETARELGRLMAHAFHNAGGKVESLLTTTQGQVVLGPIATPTPTGSKQIFLLPSPSTPQGPSPFISTASRSPRSPRTPLAPFPSKDTLAPFPSKDTLAPFPSKDTSAPFPSKDTPAPFPSKDTPAPFPSKDTPSPFPSKDGLAPFPSKDTPSPFPSKDTPSPFPSKDTPSPFPSKDTPSPFPLKDTPSPFPSKDRLAPFPSKDTNRLPVQRPRAMALLAPQRLKAAFQTQVSEEHFISYIKTNTPMPMTSAPRQSLQFASSSTRNQLLTQGTYCCLRRSQPMYVQQGSNVKISMYSNWKAGGNSQHPLGMSWKAHMALYNSSRNKKAKLFYITSDISPAKFGIVTQSGAWKPEQMTLKVETQQPETPKPLLEDSDAPISEMSATGQLEHKTKEKKPKDPHYHKHEGHRIPIFKGGFKSNENYEYVRGRGRGKYVCEECGIRCKKPSMLKKHIRTHTDMRPYQCSICNFAFKTKGNLTKHMKSKAHSKKCLENGITPGEGDLDQSYEDGDDPNHQFSDADEDTDSADGDTSDDDESELGTPCSTASGKDRPTMFQLSRERHSSVPNISELSNDDYSAGSSAIVTQPASAGPLKRSFSEVFERPRRNSMPAGSISLGSDDPREDQDRLDNLIGALKNRADDDEIDRLDDGRDGDKPLKLSRSEVVGKLSRHLTNRHNQAQKAAAAAGKDQPASSTSFDISQLPPLHPGLLYPSTQPMSVHVSSTVNTTAPQGPPVLDKLGHIAVLAPSVAMFSQYRLATTVHSAVTSTAATVAEASQASSAQTATTPVTVGAYIGSMVEPKLPSTPRSDQINPDESKRPPVPVPVFLYPFIGLHHHLSMNLVMVAHFEYPPPSAVQRPQHLALNPASHPDSIRLLTHAAVHQAGLRPTPSPQTYERQESSDKHDVNSFTASLAHNAYMQARVTTPTPFAAQPLLTPLHLAPGTYHRDGSPRMVPPPVVEPISDDEDEHSSKRRRLSQVEKPVHLKTPTTKSWELPSGNAIKQLLLARPQMWPGGPDLHTPQSPFSSPFMPPSPSVTSIKTIPGPVAALASSHHGRPPLVSPMLPSNMSQLPPTILSQIRSPTQLKSHAHLPPSNSPHLAIPSIGNAVPFVPPCARPKTPGQEHRPQLSPKGKPESPSVTESNEEFINTSPHGGNHKCSTCCKVFMKPNQLRIHMRTHLEEQTFQCHECTLEFRSRSLLAKHERSEQHLSKVEAVELPAAGDTHPRPFKCKLCQIAFRIRGHLAKHLQCVTGHIASLEREGSHSITKHEHMMAESLSDLEMDDDGPASPASSDNTDSASECGENIELQENPSSSANIIVTS
ncbi:LOW QUALITY PROTEIN: uncharacterized protein [Amphiura filiformis]|uniref:LOW QUALITY PROTEIN: uncharacterized protein n=1 Tax=Amphiura filiformis TaxID=82378 RepID=UPI003B20F833